ncbi:MAG: selenocysteine-specific translation elongation factor [Anaerolineae bacterium]
MGKLRVIGTAGHVDHGKSALVKALTGIDPDRLKEEKEREMTIDLGFAWLTLPSSQVVSIVDVPGHEDFIKNMLAGVGGIDAALLVVAADEAVMPQTREHLAILDLLRVKSGLVALAKIDLVEDEDWVELVTADVAELLRGTTLEGAPIIPVSARTGEGLPRLLEELDQILAETAPRPDWGRPRLPVDRVFTIAGFGTVVTGTLIDGRFQVGDEVEVLPQGLRSRIRGLQTHKEKIKEAVPGSRVAMNLVGVSTEQIQRGNVVTTPGWLKPTRLVDVKLEMLPGLAKPLKHNVEVEFFSGSAQIMAKARVLGAKAIPPGQSGWVQLRLQEPTVLVKNDRFIIRQPSPSLTIGGGVVIDPLPRGRHRRFRPEVIQRLEILAHGTPEEILLQSLRRQEPDEADRLVRRSNLERTTAEEALSRLMERGQVMVLGEGEDRQEELPPAGNRYLVSSAGWKELGTRISGMVGDYHRQYPLRAGMPREELKSRLGYVSRLFNEVVDLAVERGELVEGKGILYLPGHEVRFTADQQRRIDQLLRQMAKNPYAPPSLSDCQAMVGEEELNALIEQGQLTRVSENVVFLTETYQEMVERVVEYMEREGSITIAQVRDMFHTSRKYALALMEHLDERRVTKRVGDERVLRP